MTLDRGHRLRFLSTPSARRATRATTSPRSNQSISIHALREEGDMVYQYLGIPPYHISIHALREEGDASAVQGENRTKIFLSTPSARRATEKGAGKMEYVYDFYPRPPRGGRPCSVRPHRAQGSYFYPRPPRGGRRIGQQYYLAHEEISIHALREEGDVYHDSVAAQIFRFLSTPSARRATSSCLLSILSCAISIHALREEGDDVRQASPLAVCLFLSTPSARRATPRYAARIAGSAKFLSTPSARRATHEGGEHHQQKKFLSTPSARRATELERSVGGHIQISIHALREEGDALRWPRVSG